MIHMNWFIILMNYDKKRENNEKERNPGLADLRLEELEQYFLSDRRPWVFVNIPVDYCKSPQHFLPVLHDPALWQSILDLN